MRQSTKPRHRAYPDETQCRTSPVEAKWLRQEPLLSHCLNEQEACRYGRLFAYGCLCKHPRHLEFAQADEVR